MEHLESDIDIATDRLLLRKLIDSDKAGIFALDRDPEVHRYLGNKPIQSLQEATDIINYIREQYLTNGIGRWAVIEKSTGEFAGWAGLKLITQPTNGHVGYYDLGYRLMKKFWGLGYATEASRAVLKYGFAHMGLHEIYAIADARNKDSRHVLEKCGLRAKQSFLYENKLHDWFIITKDDWDRALAISA